MMELISSGLIFTFFFYHSISFLIYCLLALFKHSHHVKSLLILTKQHFQRSSKAMEKEREEIAKMKRNQRRKVSNEVKLN